MRRRRARDAVGMARRQVVAGAVALLMSPAFSSLRTYAAGPAQGQVEDSDPASSLQAAAQACNISFGVAIDREIFNDADYAALVLRHAAVIGNINSLKFDWLRPSGPQADFSFADKLVAFAEDHNRPFLGHTLIWNDWLPPWLNTQSPPEIGRTFDAHIDEVVGRYRGRVASWVVVNEPFSPWDKHPQHFRQGACFTAYGEAYIARALRRARQADPTAQLILNEAFCERRDDIGKVVRRSLLTLVKRLRDADVPLDAVGLQAHLQPQHGLDHDAYARFLADLAQEGVAIEITELDVDDSRIPGNATVRDAAVAAHYRAFLDAVTRLKAVRAITTWGLSDKYTWYREVAEKANPLSPHQPRTLPFDNNGLPKSAYSAIIDQFSTC